MGRPHVMYMIIPMKVAEGGVREELSAMYFVDGDKYAQQLEAIKTRWLIEYDATCLTIAEKNEQVKFVEKKLPYDRSEQVWCEVSDFHEDRTT